MKKILIALFLAGSIGVQATPSATTVISDDAYTLRKKEAVAQYNRAVEILSSLDGNAPLEDIQAAQQRAQDHFRKAQENAQACHKMRNDDETINEILKGCSFALDQNTAEKDLESFEFRPVK